MRLVWHNNPLSIYKTWLIIGFVATCTQNCQLTQFLLRQGCKVLGYGQGRSGNIDSGNILGLLSHDAMFSHTLFDSDVVGVLRREIWHGARVFGIQHCNICFVIIIRHWVSEELISILIADHGIRCVTSTTVGLDRHLFASFGLDSELHLHFMHILTLSKSVNSLPLGPLRVWQLEKSLPTSTHQCYPQWHHKSLPAEPTHGWPCSWAYLQRSSQSTLPRSQHYSRRYCWKQR